MEIQLLYLLIFPLVVLQTIVGVGVLVLGTPLLLIFDYDIIEVINLLLPISIITSLLNYLYLKYNKKNLKINLDKKIKKAFIIICLPGMTIGLVLAREFIDTINFKILISLIIFLSLFVRWKFKNLIHSLPLSIKKIILMFIAVIHGLTNSGGALLAIFFTSLTKNKKDQSRYSITFYYLILVFVQYLVFLIVFKKEIFIEHLFHILLIITLASIIGNIIAKIIDEKFFRKTIEILVLFSAIYLLINAQ
tara:strand:- start:96 stop:842 length:747 start_codon:yes stop_codon:yes gene_type:complete